MARNDSRISISVQIKRKGQSPSKIRHHRKQIYGCFIDPLDGFDELIEGSFRGALITVVSDLVDLGALTMSRPGPSTLTLPVSVLGVGSTGTIRRPVGVPGGGS